MAVFVELMAFSDEQLHEVHEKTLYLLETTGLIFKHEPTLELLARHGAMVEGNLVKFPSKLINEALEMVPSEFTVVGRNRDKSVKIGNGSLVFAPTSGEVFVHDIERGRREGTLKDLENFIKLCQSSDVIGVADVAIVDPSGLKGDEIVCLSMQEGIKNSDKPLQGLSVGSRQSELSIQMGKIATQATHGEHYLMGIINTFSPLAWDKNMLDALWSYCSADQPVVITCCSMGGSSAPVSLAGSIVQNNVEILAGVVVAQLIRPGVPVVYGNTSSITDMKTMSLATGAPEFSLMEIAACQLARFYKLPFRGGGGLTDAKEVDVQAGIESATNLFCTFAINADYILHGLGMTDGFMTVSYEKWIIDEEICGRLRRFYNGVDPLSNDIIQTIQDVGPFGSYLSHPSTFENFKKEFYMPTISDRDNWEKWSKNKTSILVNANKAWKKRITEFEAPPLLPKVEKELAEFVEKHI